mgnify:CR=1 FL=1
MSILEELSKKDKEWRKAAYVICKDKMLADDLVQEMYFKLMELHYIEDRTEIFEPDDEEQKILDAFDKLDWVQKELLLERANGMSLRDIQKRYNINYGYTYRETTKAKDIIKNKKK